MLAKRLGVKGVAVVGVEAGSAAAKAGLVPAKIETGGGIVPGDIILEVDGEQVDTVAELLGQLDRKQVGDTVVLTLLRDGGKTEVRATLQAAGA